MLLLGRMFKLPPRREQNFIAGLSMGGYGALFLGLSGRTCTRAAPAFPVRWDLSMMLADPAAPGVREVFGPVFGDGLLLPKSSDCGCWPSGWPRCGRAAAKGAADERPAGRGAVFHSAAERRHA